MKTIVAGSRTFTDYLLVSEIIQDHLDSITEIVSGEARGVDTFGRMFGEANNIPVVKFPADWDKYKKAAGAIRNKQMGDYADQLIAIWDGESRGTKHMIDYMESLGKPVYIEVIA